jgi:hypothetical protein
MAYFLNEVTAWVESQRGIAQDQKDRMRAGALAHAVEISGKKFVASGILEEVLGDHVSAFREAWERGFRAG